MNKTGGTIKTQTFGKKEAAEIASKQGAVANGSMNYNSNSCLSLMKKGK